MGSEICLRIGFQPTAIRESPDAELKTPRLSMNHDIDEQPGKRSAQNHNMT